MQRAFDIASMNVTVIGAARSGLAAARLLHQKGGRVFLTEFSPAEAFAESARILREEGIPHEFGGHSARVFAADMVVVSPGVPSDAPVVVEAERRGLPVISEIEVGTMFLDGPIIAVTGTNGKTTTTTLCGEICDAAGRNTLVAGNIGRAFTDALRAHAGAIDIAVLEVSSFQLDTCLTFHPSTAVITTITPDHLNRYHGDFQEYVASKQRIFMNQCAQDHLIYNHDDPVVSGAIKTAAAELFPVSAILRLGRGGWRENGSLMIDAGFGKELLARVDDLQVYGRHNYMNVLMAGLAARLEGIGIEVIRQACMEFRGVEHRLEFVCEVDGVRWINDSKATNVDSVVIALQSYRQPVVLIAGGRDKGASYEPLFDLIRERVRAMVLIGEAAEKMEREFAPHTRVTRARDMSEAVNIARMAAQPGDVAMLSPACASFDMFENFEQRGQIFKECVHTFCREPLVA
ncbi:MAG: UDP-N-acetylmuramoyl-L-alanine--D-glutamate ligase [Bacteroidota bacterium]|jgi:UDP-N-acetylmuramoylalanine--D-glutamate ligase|nr:UDP-N-acetylmuramoyl-L-alanine--D-glutamate ligase [Bacteroidota bacterium]